MKKFFDSFNFVYNNLINEASDFYLNAMGGTSEHKQDVANYSKNRNAFIEAKKSLTPE